MKKIAVYLVIPVLLACTQNNKTIDRNSIIDFGQPVRVEVVGYSGNAMEPFLSRDGKTLLFNNLNSAPENTNLHWATKIDDSTFYYKGEIAGINTVDLEGVPTIDTAGNFYFVSTRNYATTLSTLYQCQFAAGTATNVKLIDGVSKLQAGWVNFDIEVSADGQFIYFVDARFNQTGTPETAELVIAKRDGTGFRRLANSETLLENINTNGLNYAACISVNQLELYFTRVELPLTAASLPEIFVSTRTKPDEPFGSPSKIQGITGFAEAPTISVDQRILYYHKKENNKFVLYLIKKK